MSAHKIYVGGSLREPSVPLVAADLRAAGHSVFCDWYTAGENADDRWREYEEGRGFTYREALAAPAACNVFDFDKKWLDWANTFVQVMPSGKSACVEGCYVQRHGEWIIYYPDEDPERWDVMLKFADSIVYSKEELLSKLGMSATYSGPLPQTTLESWTPRALGSSSWDVSTPRYRMQPGMPT